MSWRHTSLHPQHRNMRPFHCIHLQKPSKRLLEQMHQNPGARRAHTHTHTHTHTHAHTHTHTHTHTHSIKHWEGMSQEAACRLIQPPRELRAYHEISVHWLEVMSYEVRVNEEHEFSQPSCNTKLMELIIFQCMADKSRHMDLYVG